MSQRFRSCFLVPSVAWAASSPPTATPAEGGVAGVEEVTITIPGAPQFTQLEATNDTSYALDTFGNVWHRGGGIDISGVGSQPNLTSIKWPAVPVELPSGVTAAENLRG